MPSPEPPRFEFIRDLYPELAETEILEAEARFARVLDILADIALEQASPRSGDSSNPERRPIL